MPTNGRTERALHGPAKGIGHDVFCDRSALRRKPPSTSASRMTSGSTGSMRVWPGLPGLPKRYAAGLSNIPACRSAPRTARRAPRCPPPPGLAGQGSGPQSDCRRALFTPEQLDEFTFAHLTMRFERTSPLLEKGLP
jgi:hypothetical protein